MTENGTRERARTTFGIEKESVWIVPWVGYLIAMMCGAVIFSDGVMDVAAAVIGLPVAFAVGWAARYGTAPVVLAWVRLLAAGFAAGVFGRYGHLHGTRTSHLSPGARRSLRSRVSSGTSSSSARATYQASYDVRLRRSSQTRSLNDPKG